MSPRTRVVARTALRLLALTFAQWAVGVALAVDDNLADLGGDDA